MTTVAGSYNPTDIGNAERLVARFGPDLHYVPKAGHWLVWDSTRWRVDDIGEAERWAKETVRAIYGEAQECLDTRERSELAKWALRSESDGRIRAMLARAQVEPGVGVRPAELDANPWLLAAANGTIDLRTGALLPHRREDRITKMTPVAYDPAAQCPRWEAFLHRVMAGSVELTTFLQRAVGYSLTGDVREQCLFLLHGSGANGKSTFLGLIRNLLGEYTVQADFATFLEAKASGPRNDIARLAGARLVTSSEVGEGRRLAESVVKTLTGGDTISARFLYNEAFEFEPQFKLWLAANHKPVIRGTDVGMWRRVNLVPFEVQIPDAEQDGNLKETLRRELPGILRWAVEGCLAWLESGLMVPDAVSAATQAYKNESDVLGAFLDECCEVRPGTMVQTTAIYNAYKEWADSSGEYRMSQTMFGRQLQERGFVAEKCGVGATRLKYRMGLRLTGLGKLSALGTVRDSSRVVSDSSSYSTNSFDFPSTVPTVPTVPAGHHWEPDSTDR